MGITSVESLQRHIEWAMRVELSLIPPYLYAMYSLADQASEPALLIRSVVAEEMLHAALAANLLISIGGEPRFYDEAAVPAYPMALPHHKPELEISLAPASPELMELFMVVEQPKAVEGFPDDDEYESQGQFYSAIEDGFERLHGSGDLFAANRPERQMGDPSYYGAVEYDADDSGGLVLVTGIESVREAVDTIIHQGEGLSEEKWADPEHRELTHYQKFLRIHTGESPLGAVNPVPANPRAADFPDPIRVVADLFNAAYSYLLVTLDRIYLPMGKAERDALVGDFYGQMSDVLGPVGRHLTRQPLPGGGCAAPTFEFHGFGDDPSAELAELAGAAAALHPELGSVRDRIARLR